MSRESGYERELREFLHVLDTVPIAYRPPRGQAGDQMLRQLIERDPERARRLLADLEKDT